MTALDAYVRLESTGLWRAGPGAEPVEVIVSFGNATLQLSTIDDEPLSHWALSATWPVGREGERVIYAPDATAPESAPDETLAIDDPQMIAAIEKVSAWLRTRPGATGKRRRRRLWAWVLVLALAGLVGSGAWVLPDMIRTQAEALTGQATLIALSDAILAENQRRGALVCDDPQGRRALARFRSLMLPPDTPRIVVQDSALSSPVVLPDGRTLLGRPILDAAISPVALAAQVQEARLRATRASPLALVLADAGPWVAIGLIRGQLPPAGLATDALLQRAGERGAEPAAGSGAGAADTPAPTAQIDDLDWVALQGICQR